LCAVRISLLYSAMEADKSFNFRVLASISARFAGDLCDRLGDRFCFTTRQKFLGFGEERLILGLISGPARAPRSLRSRLHRVAGRPAQNSGQLLCVCFRCYFGCLLELLARPSRRFLASAFSLAACATALSSRSLISLRVHHRFHV
jgi:hypothetical protein